MNYEQFITIPGLNNKLRIIPTSNEIGCVDPRWYAEPDHVDSELITKLSINRKDLAPHNAGAIRTPGASLGDAMILSATTRISPEQSVRIVKTYDGERYTIHCDDHGPHTGSLGCGHYDKAKKHSKLYGLEECKVEELRWHSIRELTPKRVPVLTGAHNEVGVLVVQGSNEHTVKAVSGDLRFFRYDQTRHEQRLNDLAYITRANGINVSGDELLEIAQKQRNATLGLIANGLPVYMVDLSRVSSPSVRQIGIVGEID